MRVRFAVGGAAGALLALPLLLHGLAGPGQTAYGARTAPGPSSFELTTVARMVSTGEPIDGAPAFHGGAAGRPVALAQASQNPHGEITYSCTDCHTTESWSVLRDPLPFDHGRADFPMDGGHRGASCTSCHRSLMFPYVPTACADCHADPHRGELGLSCEGCHTPAGWEDREQAFTAHFTTLFPLTGAHATVDCEACHRPEAPFEFSTTPVECDACHAVDFRNATDPRHQALGFSTDCVSCHTVDGWQGATLTVVDHGAFFPLTGAHASVDCVACHASGFASTPTTCFSCHADEYRSAPSHVRSGFPTRCQSCHSTQSWEGALFERHDTFFPLTGAHGRVDCDSCHTSGFAGTPTDCFSCHATDFRSAQNPDHQALGFSTSCESCHTTANWDTTRFLDHDEVFPLLGAHARLNCQACHASGYAGTPTDCYSCHTADYRGTQNPNHTAAGFSTACESCHTSQSWTGAAFDHDSVYALTGAHRSAACESCHTSGYAGTPTDCYSCHTTDYRGTRNPNHTAAGFPTTCETCHTTQRWTGAAFNHDQYYPLTGQHRTTACQLCHTSGYAGTPTDCYSCHATDYRTAQNPDHQAAGFPTTCDSCHTTQRWTGAVFNHDQSYFPIYSGKHRGEWSQCADCHVQPANFRVFECILCHDHNQSSMANEHDDVSGYRWVSAACYQCHPDGQE